MDSQLNLLKRPHRGTLVTGSRAVASDVVHSPDNGPGILIAADVIDPLELATLIGAAREAVAPAAAEVLSSHRTEVDLALASLSALRSQLAELEAHTTYFSTQRLQRAPGIRRRLAYEIKRTVRRVTSWYVEPRWMLQQAVNRELSALLDTMERNTAHLRDDLDELAMWRRRVDHRTNGDDRQ